MPDMMKQARNWRVSADVYCSSDIPYRHHYSLQLCRQLAPFAQDEVKSMSGNVSGSLRRIIACVLLTCVANAAAQDREWGINREIVQVFDDTAITIGHKNILPHILRERRPSSVPQITFEESMDVMLGGVTVNLLYLGPSHSDNLIQVHVRAEKVLVAVACREDVSQCRTADPVDSL
jgi:hypothetical protein